jgi:hypothetical protein
MWCHGCSCHPKSRALPRPFKSERSRVVAQAHDTSWLIQPSRESPMTHVCSRLGDSFLTQTRYRSAPHCFINRRGTTGSWPGVRTLALPLRERREIPGSGPCFGQSGNTYARAPASAPPRIIAMRVHIDGSRADNGPLRVLPGTHTLVVLSDGEIWRLARRDSNGRMHGPDWRDRCDAPAFSCTLRPRPKRSIRAGCCTSSTATRSIWGMASSWRLPESGADVRPRSRILSAFVRPSHGCRSRAARRRRQGPEAARMRAVGAERRALHAAEHSTRIECVMAGVIHVQHLR